MRQIVRIWLLAVLALLALTGPVASEAQKRKDAQQKASPQHRFVQDPVAELIADLPELAKLKPAENQAELPEILSNAADRARAFANNAVSVAANERVTQQLLFPNGKVRKEQQSTFSYIILSHVEMGDLVFEEYRTDVHGNRASQAGLEQGFMITTQFAATLLRFDPGNQQESTFRYLGEDASDGVNALVVAFAQVPGARMTTRVWKNGVMKEVLIQGIAWISKKDFQVLRVRSNFLEPIPEINLTEQTTDVRFSEVHPEGTDTAIWVPQQVTVTATQGGQHLRNFHTYSNWRVFRVSIEFKPGVTPP